MVSADAERSVSTVRMVYVYATYSDLHISAAAG
jgi:hypothetical protein